MCFSVVQYTQSQSMGNPADSTIIDTLHKEGEPQKVTAEKADCSQSAASKHVGREKHEVDWKGNAW